MSADEPFYDFINFREGTLVRIPSRAVLEEFSRTWKYHHKLEPEQLEFGDRVAKVVEIQMYHGADILYGLEDVPGLWHQHLLQPANGS